MITNTINSNLRCRTFLREKLFLLLYISFLTSNITNAQNNRIVFESGDWEEIKIKATKENKLIFLDAYATWCGICKKMDRNVFTDDSVADYFNTHFINAKIDMELGAGLDIARQYNVNVYPTLLFVDAQGKVLHRAVGSHNAQELISLAKDAQNPGKQYTGTTNTYDAGDIDETQTSSNNFEIGLNISQYQRDFGIGLHVISPYFMMKMFAIKLGTNMQWFENFNGTETVFTNYQNIQLGMRGRSTNVTQNISVYGEGGVFIILPNSAFSSKSSVVGGYGLFGFEFRVLPRFAYFIELGGIGTGAKADKIAGNPIYSTGFLTNAGLKIGF